MERYSYPHTIENGAGERITFFRKVPSDAGDRLEIENVVSPGSGPPMHIHHYQEEALTVVHGRMGYQRDGEPPQFARQGDTVTFKVGEPHKFWNADEQDLKCRGYVVPADNVEYFLTQLYDSSKRHGGGRPDAFDAAFLITRYRSEFSMVEIPAFVQRLLFPLQVAVGRLLGRYRKYDDAPAPVRR
jgi:quercetin dioxygenase-like cupin family protein